MNVPVQKMLDDAIDLNRKGLCKEARAVVIEAAATCMVALGYVIDYAYNELIEVVVASVNDNEPVSISVAMDSPESCFFDCLKGFRNAAV